ncbi:response regulator [Woodsholea maritima]|uniref:response regulator n=1 Tax=Woodsholea maritima TaxID=240237 RepID=UPI000370CA14|nr:response regulator [Woodsholea maritima]
MLLDKMQPIDILLVEDNDNDVLLTKLAFENSKLANRIFIAEDGEEALDFLFKRGKHVDAPRPDIVLLDLNLPKIDGKQVLDIVKSDEDLRTIPVVVLTSSEAERDILESYKLHANSYMTKPVDVQKFVEVAGAIEDFWFTVVVLPPEGPELDDA